MKSKYLIIGAGVHGLSTAWNLCKKLKKKNQLKDNSVVVLEKTKVASGAGSISCGIARNNYFQPSMRELMAHSINVWNENAKQLTFHKVGYMQINSQLMVDHMSQVYEQQKNIGFDSTFVTGSKDCDKYMKNLFDDWQAQGIESVLHEKNSGYGHNRGAILGLAELAKKEGVKILEGIEVLEINNGSGTKVAQNVKTTKGVFEFENLIVAVGPWVEKFWKLMGYDDYINVNGSKQRMWSYNMLEEGELEYDPKLHTTNDHKESPILHVDTEATLISKLTGNTIHENEIWGIYYKPDVYRNCIQGGSSPRQIKTEPHKIELEPYGHDSKKYKTSSEFYDKWTSALAFCQKRFEGKHKNYRKRSNGGVGCLTPDKFPVFDVFNENIYLVADSNHGWKMVGVGELVADELLGKKSSILEPFRFNRYEQGKLHPRSKSPFPWS